MAQKSGDLRNVDKLDPISTSAGGGTGPDQFLDRYAGDYPESSSERREMEANVGEHPEETEHIKAQIEETRNQMGETIDAIQEKLSFSNVSEQVSEHVTNAIETAKDTIYDATVGKAVYFMKNVGDGISDTTIIRTARNNPFPLVLIGLGAGLLAYQSYRGGSMRRGNGGDRQPDRYRFSGDAGQRSTGEFGAGSTRGDLGRKGDGRSGVSSVREGLSSATGRAYESVSSVAGTAYEGVTGKVSDVYAGANDVAHRAYERVGEFGHIAQEQYDHYIQESPLAVGAVAAALGAAVGFAIPSTRYEGQLMGEARQNLMQKVQDTTGEFANKAKHVVDEAVNTVKEEARTLTE